MNEFSEQGSPIQTDSLEGKRGTWYVYAISLVAAVGGFLFGYDLSIMSGAIIFLRDHFHLGPVGFGLAASCAVIGCIFGPISGLWLADAIGRKKTMAIASLCFMISAIGSAMAQTMVDFVIWRALGGVGVGLAMVISPMYIAEISPPRLRGRLVTVNQLAIVIGINLSIVVAYFLSFGGHWRWMFATEVVPIVALMSGLCFAPRSPRWLAAKSLDDEALGVLTKINGIGRAQTELQEIKEELTEEVGTFKELFQPGVRMALLIGVILMIFQQINGVNMLILYTPTILIEAGISTPSDALLNALYVNVCILLSTIIAFWLVGRFPRRYIIMGGVTAMALGHVLMGFAFMFKLPPMMMLVIMFLSTSAFTLTLAPLAWVILSEIFPNRIRGKAMSIVCVFLFTASFLCLQIFPILTNWFDKTFGNPGGAYWIFASICMGCVLFTWRVIPETKGLSLEQIGKFWLHYEKRSASKNE